MSPIRKLAFATACAGLVVSAPMASARSTSGGVPAFSVSAAAPSTVNVPDGTISDDGRFVFRGGKWFAVKGGKLFLLLGAVLVTVTGIVILATNSR